MPRTTMVANADTIRLLKRCFSASEWEWLAFEDEFQSALESLDALDKVEPVIALGLKLISQARLGTRPRSRPPPPPAQGSGRE